MRIRILVLFAVLMISLSLAALGYAQTGSVYFKEEFNYSSLDQMQTGGWTFTRPAGISVATSAVTLDGTGGDCAIHHPAGFSNDVFDWRAEVKTMWLGHGHSVLSVFLATDHHAYGWAADGYYKEFSFYRDSKKILHFGIYQEKANQFVVLAMVRQGNTFSFYFNGELKNTYTENDTGPAKLTSLDLVSPWKGDAKYNYYMVGEPTAVSPTGTTNPTLSPTDTTSSFPTIPVIIGGTIAAVVVGGALVYYFVIAGGAAGASAGSATGAAGGVGGAGGGQLIHTSGTSAGSQGTAYLHELMSNMETAVSIFQDWQEGITHVSSLSDMVANANTLAQCVSVLTGGDAQATVPAISGGALSGGAIAASNMVQNVQTLIDQAISQGQNLTNEAATQNSINEDSYQQYLQQCTNIVDHITQMMNVMTSTETGVVHNME